MWQLLIMAPLVLAAAGTGLCSQDRLQLPLVVAFVATSALVLRALKYSTRCVAALGGAVTGAAEGIERCSYDCCL